jgi:hypothetical protein
MTCARNENAAVCRCKKHHQGDEHCEGCERVAVELPYHLTQLKENERLLTVLVDENVFDCLMRPESQANFFRTLKTCAGYWTAWLAYEDALRNRWLPNYIPHNVDVSAVEPVLRMPGYIYIFRG